MIAKRRFLPSVALLVSAVAGLLLPSALAQNYTLTPVNNTGLDPATYTIYMMGYSTSSNMVLQRDGSTPTGVFVSQSSGAMPYIQMGSGANQINSISLPSNVPLNGARIYMIVVQNGVLPPTLNFGQQPPTPPASYPPYTFVEVTVPTSGDATVDVQAVDGYTMPITITENGNFNIAGSQYGQPVYNTGTAVVNRQAIIEAYQIFMGNQGTPGDAYSDLLYAAQYTVEGPYGGILSPRTYLAVQTAQGQPANVGVFDDLFDTELNTLFGNSTMKIRGVASGNGELPVILPDTYTVAPVTQNYPGTSIALPALQLTGTTVPTNIFYIFNPVGVTILANDAGAAITGTLVGSTLTLNGKVSSIANGMYVGGVGMVVGGQFVATVASFDNSGANTVATLNNAPAAPAPNSQFLFSKLPFTATAESAGWMVLAQNGLFNDGVVQYPNAGTQAGLQTVLNSFENFISTAVNRGVAILPAALNPTDPTNLGLTSQVWADQTQWYPAGQTQNLYSKFLHTGTLGGSSIFSQPANAIAGMGSAYAFPYDENSGPTPPATDTTEVPSKFDQNVAPGTTITVTLGQWAGPTPTPAPTPAPAPAAPTVKVDGKKTVKTTKSSLEIKGSAVGAKVFVKYKDKSGKVVNKKVTLKSDGKWTYKFKPFTHQTALKFYSENSAGQKSSQQEIKVIDDDK